EGKTAPPLGIRSDFSIGRALNNKGDLRFYLKSLMTPMRHFATVHLRYHETRYSGQDAITTYPMVNLLVRYGGL
ncbi:hypothetical protein HAX54_042154, partial [Datura stramonium]|nr:hypothetical protein [Datura stramonium]